MREIDDTVVIMLPIGLSANGTARNMRRYPRLAIAYYINLIY